MRSAYREIEVKAEKKVRRSVNRETDVGGKFFVFFAGLTQLLATSTNYSLLTEAWTL
jgi:hypothetical protein